jgi:hypothetical protein
MFLAKFSVTTSGYYLLWATYGASATASSACTGLAIATDSEGCYITGNCGPTAAAFTFYNADTTNTTNATLTATVGTRDGFLVKFNTIGTPQWTARMAVASSTVNSTGIACSADAGVVIVGAWTGGSALIVGVSSPTATVIGGSTGSQDAFVAKFTTAGAVTWVSRIGAGGQGPMSVAVALDLSINVTGGILNGTWALYTQPGTTSAASTGAIAKSCAYVAKWNSAGTGQWIQLITTTLNNPNYGLAIAVDAFSNVFASGLMFGTTTFGGTKTFVVLGEDGYVAKYTPTGALAWAVQMDEIADTNKTFCGGVSYDRRAGVLWTTGSFNNTTNFYDNNSLSSGQALAARGTYDTFIVKYSA